MAEKILVNSEISRDEFLVLASKLYDEHRHVTFSYSLGKQRSLPQNSALHLFLRQVSDAMNDAGIEQHVFFNEGFTVSWNDKTIKNEIWRPVQKAVCGELSTKKPTRAQYIEIYEYINRKLSDHGIHIPWPTKERE